MIGNSYFKLPTEDIKKNAIGSLPGTPYRIRKSLQAMIPYFQTISAPKQSDWLWDHQEQGQTFDTYKGTLHNEVNEKKNRIYIQPLQKNIPDYFLERLKGYCQAFFLGVKIETLKYLDLKTIGIANRINEYTGKIQFNAGQILKYLEKRILANAFCVIGVTLSDLYPRDQWNFVFGLASIKNRTGVFSFARYDQAFFEEGQYEVNYQKIFYRSVKVMVHEIGHMFGMRHCIFFNCVMNGSNHLDQNLKKPMELCPVCLRKLQSNIKFDILLRYKKLFEIIQKQKADPLVLKTAKILHEIIQRLDQQFKQQK